VGWRQSIEKCFPKLQNLNYYCIRSSVDDFEVQLFFGGTQVVEQVEDLVQNPVRTRAWTVNLVDAQFLGALESIFQYFAATPLNLRFPLIFFIYY
jgi:hypothetical protein